MNREEQKVSVQIFGELHVIRGKGSEDYIRGLAALVDSRMREVAQKFPRLAAHQVAILVALNLADELTRLKEEHKTVMDLLGENEQR
ncbi:MAG TPA: cell division protein ZapA [Peptococcaceae bacterium]|nr:cell division protein ZapA [Peptococcaceae bacterium]